MIESAPSADSDAATWQEWTERIVHGTEGITSLNDAIAILGLLEGAAEASAAVGTLMVACDIAGPILALVAGLYAILDADGTDAKVAGARGFAYGVTWGVLGKGTPSATCGGPNNLFPDHVQEEQQKWNAGATEGAAKGAETTLRNRCLIWMAKNNDHGDQLLRHFATDAASHLGLSGSQLSDLFSNLSVDTPVC